MAYAFNDDKSKASLGEQFVYGTFAMSGSVPANDSTGFTATLYHIKHSSYDPDVPFPVDDYIPISYQMGLGTLEGTIPFGHAFPSIEDEQEYHEISIGFFNPTNETATVNMIGSVLLLKK